MVSSTTPRFGPRWPPVLERTSISSLRTSCASCGRSSSDRALMSSGDWIPSSKRCVAVGVSEETNVDIFWFSFGLGRCRSRCGAVLKFLHDRFPGAIAGDDFDPLLGGRKSFLTNPDQLHPFLVAHDQFFERQIARFHLLDDFLEPLHCLFEIGGRRGLLHLTRHNGKGAR